MPNSPLKSWLQASRPRTLPLALSGILLGNFLAYSRGHFDWGIAISATVTALLLQILSNFANDYGDSLHGADTDDRFGPQRMVGSGEISIKGMKKAVIITGALAFISGLLTLYFSLDVIGYPAAGLLLLLGIFSIIAAYNYTASEKPYGYQGYGDVSVFLFFGLLAVGGSYALQVGNLNIWVLLPAFSIGLFSTGVLNINNLRDLPTDEPSDKKTIPVRIGLRSAKIYHVLLLVLGSLFTLIYAARSYDDWHQWPFLLVLLPFLINGLKVWKGQNPEDFAPLLKQLAIGTLVYAVGFGIGTIL